MSEDVETGDSKPDLHRERPHDRRVKERSAQEGAIQFSSAVSPEQRELLKQVAGTLNGGGDDQAR